MRAATVVAALSLLILPAASHAQNPTDVPHLMQDAAVRAALASAKANEDQVIADEIRFCEIPAPEFQEGKRAEEVLAQRSIRSPVNGVVVAVLLRPGELASSNQKDPIMKLMEVDPLNVELVLPVAQYGRIKVGQRALVAEQRAGGPARRPAGLGGTTRRRKKVITRAPRRTRTARSARRLRNRANAPVAVPPLRDLLATLLLPCGRAGPPPQCESW